MRARGPLRAFAGAAVLVALLAGAAPEVARAEQVTKVAAIVRTPDEPGPRRVDAWLVDGVDYLDLNDVARVFRSTKFWRAELEKMVLKVDGRLVRVTVGSPFVFVDDEGFQLVAPARWLEGRIVVPVDLATEVLDRVVPQAVSWNRESRVLSVDTGEPNVLAIGYDVRRNGTVAEVTLGAPLAGELAYPAPEQVELRIPTGVLDPSLVGERAGVGLLAGVHGRQEPGVATLTFRLGPMGGNVELLTRPSPPRLLLAVSEAIADDIPLPDFERRQAAGDPHRDVRVVVLDPGHGGSDPGVSSASGMPEKEITLGIAQRAKRRLEREGLEVHLTRASDRFLSPEARAELANGLHADVVVSIHCNGWFDEELRGFSVGVPRSAEPAADEEMPRWGSRDVRCRRDTETLAEILLHAMGESLPIPNRGVRAASFAMIEGTRSPAVHVECGFLTNRSDAANLVDPEFQETVAQAIADGVGRFRRFVASGEVGAP